MRCAWHNKHGAAVVRLLLAVSLAAALAACGGDEPLPQPSPSPRSTVTLTRLVPGTQVTVSAAVQAVLSPSSFVLTDVDLAPAGLLVVARAPAPVAEREFVTVDGWVVQFHYAELRGQGLAAPAAYARYEGQPSVLADRVRRLAERGPGPSGTSGAPETRRS
jgi:hypothetical protein